jgi:hypothetical protein
MKTIFVCFFVLLVVFSGCANSGKLTTSKAQNAIDTFLKGREGSAKVTGIQEIPQQNGAKVDITFSNLKLKEKTGYGIIVGESERIYSGPGVAVFTHYNDGRWVLTKVSTEEGFNSIWWDKLSVEAN